MTNRAGSALWRKRSRRFRSGLLAVAVGVLFAFPFYWVVVTSLNGSNRVFQFPPSFLPGGVVHNYTRAWDEAAWARYFLNTVLIAGSTVALVLATSLLAGFAPLSSTACIASATYPSACVHQAYGGAPPATCSACAAICWYGCAAM